LIRLKATKKEQEKASVDFIEAVNRYAKNERGEKVNVEADWQQEYFTLIAHEQINTVLITGAAQIGKTLALTLLMVYWLVEKQYNCAWFYPQLEVLNRLVPIQFLPIVKYWLETRNVILNKDKRQNNRLFQVGVANANFSYLSTSSSSSAGNKGAVAGAAVVGFSADCAFIEERSQCSVGSTAPVARRLDASRIPTHPIRELGTPGNGQGIESEIETADYYFYPHCRCSLCKNEIVLNPKGILLKSSTKNLPNGETKEAYLSEAGRPITWFFRDEKDPIASAYFACPHCKAEIREEDRTDKAYFKCLYTGVLLKDFLKKYELKSHD
jgi:hypothetical protein